MDILVLSAASCIALPIATFLSTFARILAEELAVKLGLLEEE